MARQGLSRPSRRVDRASIVPHDRWQRERSTGSIELALSTLPGRFVSPGTGRLALVGSAGVETVVHRAARSLDHPVLPGSGIKGAVRTLFELLSASCNPFDFSSSCGREQACEACSLFGARGFAGRVSFSDASPFAPPPPTSEIRWLPVGHDPKGDKTNGEFRLYDLQPSAAGTPGAKEPAKALREVYTGRFRTRLSFVNLRAEELGRLLLCCGLGAKGEIEFPLRLGGVKYEGQGAVRVEIESIALRFPNRASLSAETARAEAVRWITVAISSPWAETFGATYRNLVETLGEGGGRS